MKNKYLYLHSVTYLLTTLFAFACLSAVEPAGVPVTSLNEQTSRTVIFEFPELGKMAKEQTAAFELSFPAGYTLEKDYPLLVWFSGGRGKYRIEAANHLVDSDQFVVAAFPYPDGRLPRLAIRDGGIEEFEAFYTVMLAKLQEAVPNLSESIRIVAGSSSGGHLIGSALDLDWPAFTHFFTVYILHEGGYSPNMTFSGLPEDARALILYGEKSTSLKWQRSFMKRFREAAPEATFLELPEAGHSLNVEGRAVIKAWIETELLATAE